MTFEMSAPSKTFLTGEYAVLAGGPALVLNTAPRFRFHAVKDRSLGEAEISGIPEGSPAHVWLRQRQPLLEGWKIDFQDPHDKRGGFGASGAQFLFVHTFTTLLQSAGRSPQLNPADIFNDYQVCSKGSGSGADILAQLKGGASRIDVKEVSGEGGDWPYPELGFGIARTGSKLPTHLHLQTLKRESLKELIAPAADCARSFGVDSWRDFAAKVKNYEEALRGLGLQAQRTIELLAAYKSRPWCLAAKGCGAWGADTILILFPKEHASEAAHFSESQGMPFVATELTGGLEVIHETD
jgi:mevalonate kinase